jgi:hypothetical protein
MDSSIKFLTAVYISFSVAQHDVTHHPAYQPARASQLANGQYNNVLLGQGYRTLRGAVIDEFGALKNDENLRARRKSRSSAISFTTNTT